MLQNQIYKFSVLYNLMVFINLGAFYAEEDNFKDLIVTEIPYKSCRKPLSQHPNKQNYPVTEDSFAFNNITYEHIDLKDINRTY
ncbi:MAG: hypothetical protein K2Q34_00185 [Alphaproteobacteria bacterium]|nr:hypothetical protein [Alphaproteobacteria bacterium]